MLSDDTKKPIL